MTSVTRTGEALRCPAKRGLNGRARFNRGPFGSGALENCCDRGDAIMRTTLSPAPLQQDLFDAATVLPEGFTFQTEFIATDEEQRLLEVLRALPLEEAQYKQYRARRRTLSYGSQYDFSENELQAAPTIPDFLNGLRSKVATLAAVPAESFVQALLSEYRPGTPLGWHRDVPEFEAIAGVSLGGSCRMRLRPYRPGEKQVRSDVLVLPLPPRSAYVIRGVARWGWQHSIAPTPDHRYSITFRTLRRVEKTRQSRRS